MSDQQVAGPTDVGLAQVYDIDPTLGNRTEDVPLWLNLVGRRSAVVEIGCGTGRLWRAVAQTLPDRPVWVGVDADPDMAQRYHSATGEQAVLGRAQDPATWQAVADRVRDDPLVIVPFSTLYLIPHDEQIETIRLARQTFPRGSIAIECFAPRWLPGADVEELNVTGQGLARGPHGERWARTTYYSIRRDTRTTLAERLYGPVGRPQLRVLETIYWRTVEDLEAMVRSVATVQRVITGGHGAAPGHVVVVAR